MFSLVFFVWMTLGAVGFASVGGRDCGGGLGSFEHFFFFFLISGAEKPTPYHSECRAKTAPWSLSFTTLYYIILSCAGSLGGA